MFNSDADFDCNHVNGIKQKLMLYEMGEAISFNEFCHAINRLTWHKSPVTNSTSPNTIKSLDANNKIILFEFIKAWMDDENIKYED